MDHLFFGGYDSYCHKRRIYMHPSIHMYILYTYIHIHTYKIYVYIYIYIYIYIRTHIRTWITSFWVRLPLSQKTDRICIPLYTCTYYIHTYTYTHIKYMYTYIYIYIYIHTYTYQDMDHLFLGTTATVKKDGRRSIRDTPDTAYEVCVCMDVCMHVWM